MITDYQLILASNSPRRKQLLSGLDVKYEVKTLPDIDESYPDNIASEDVAQYLACKKAEAYQKDISGNMLVITADTVVILDNIIYGKPNNETEAKQMLRNLSGKTHKVITGVCLTSANKQKAFSVHSDVRFSELEDDEIDYYVSKYKPFDKAGAYGIQEWIGYISVEYISGSYFNIMGLPIQRLYKELKQF
ncbi:septum formation protein Maf [Dysgonomonas sp. 216]|uniref:Maf-like protein n=1 Tax=Dysgonomonas sp. 216 TaxID=2302934 RepID=UPI0013D12143|nr:Maf-like protein [Dysgonomonas sp. 216]NDW19365.1 septum formation protein Maf [Dysgonomonas sp. 216]